MDDLGFTSIHFRGDEQAAKRYIPAARLLLIQRQEWMERWGVNVDRSRHRLPDGVTVETLSIHGINRVYIDVTEETEPTRFAPKPPVYVWLVHSEAPINFQTSAGFKVTRYDARLEQELEEWDFPWYRQNVAGGIVNHGRFLPPPQTFTVGYDRLLWLHYEKLSEFDDRSDYMRVTVQGIEFDTPIQYEHIAGRDFDPEIEEDASDFDAAERRLAYQGWGPVGITCNKAYIGVILINFGEAGSNPLTDLDYFDNTYAVDLWTWSGEFVRRIQFGGENHYLVGANQTLTGEGVTIPPGLYTRNLRVELTNHAILCWTHTRSNGYSFDEPNQVEAFNFEGGPLWASTQVGSWSTLDQEGAASDQYVIQAQSYQSGFGDSSDMGIWSRDGAFLENVNLGVGLSGSPLQSPDAMQACMILGDVIYLACGFIGATSALNFSVPTTQRVYQLSPNGFQRVATPVAPGEGRRVWAILRDRTKDI